MKENTLVSSAARDPRYQAVVVFFLCALLTIASGLAQAQGGVVDSTLNPIQPAQTFTTLVNFNQFNGAIPNGGVIQGTDGYLYVTTWAGGQYCVSFGGCGTAFKMAADGTLSLPYLRNFSSAAIGPAGLLQGRDGNFYGVTEEGGSDCGVASCGTVFKITPTGGFSILHKFNGADGEAPFYTLVEGADGNFYGTTYASTLTNGAGTVFKVTSAGNFVTLYQFLCSGTDCSNGGGPSGLVRATSGNFYGTTSYGHGGTAFKITPDGKLTTIHSFVSQDGGLSPVGTLIQGADGFLYGAAQYGGAINSTCPSGGGTIFRIALNGAFTGLHKFCTQSGADGVGPLSGMVQGSDGALYGTTGAGGANNHGTIFRFAGGASFLTLHSFEGTDGDRPFAVLFQATNGDFYGSTQLGGTSNLGTLFRLSTELGPFVDLQPNFGVVGTPITIRGNKLTGTTSVTFGSIPAVFTVVSDTEILTTVPAKANKGVVKVDTPNSTLKSKATFKVPPTISAFSPSSGPPGTVVTILGKTFDKTGSVSFGGVPATSFTVNSYTSITATVPPGAKNGNIAVTTGSGTGQSSSAFTVTP